MQRLVIELKEDGLIDVRREVLCFTVAPGHPEFEEKHWGLNERHLTSELEFNAHHLFTDRIDLYGTMVGWAARREHEECLCFTQPHACPVHGDEAYRQLTTRS